MKHKSHNRTIFSLCLVALTWLAFTSAVKANPYATELANSSGTVSFTLNESADQVEILFGTTVTNIGPLAAGSYSTNVGATSPFSVRVAKNSGPGYKTPSAPNVATQLLISKDTNRFAHYANGRGLAVIKNPASPFFGRIYVAGNGGAVSSNHFNLGIGLRTTGDGLYTLKSDFSDSPNGYGDTAQNGTATGLGINFAASTSSPYRLSAGQDGYVYIADWSDAYGGVYRVDGNLRNGAWVLNYFGGPGPATNNHGSTQKVIAEGSVAENNLTVYTLDEDYGGITQNDILRYDVGNTLSNEAAPAVITGVLISANLSEDFTKGGPSNYLYAIQYRAYLANAPCLYVVDTNGVTITNTADIWLGISGGANDILTNAQSIAVSPDGKWLAIIFLNTVGAGGFGNSDTLLIPLTPEGIPDLANRLLLDTGVVTQGRGVDFDAAGNLYTLSSGDLTLRCFSPGGYTVATTDSSGTFNIYSPPEVTVTAATPLASETGPTDGVFTLSRADTTGSLLVNYTLSGTAANGLDYDTLPGSVTFQPGDATTNITVTTSNDPIAELSETVTLAIASTANAIAGTPGSATVVIQDNELSTLDISLVHSNMYERLANDYLTFRITRRGDTNATTFSVNTNFTGTATHTADYTVPTLSIDPGVVTYDFTVTPVDDSLVEGPETVTCVIAAAGAGEYAIGTNEPVSGIIVDDEVPTESVLFSDNFDTDTSANWKLTFAAANGLDDYRTNWVYDYSADGVPSAPHSSGGTTLGLRLNVNKDESTAAGAAGINLYPVGQSFSNNYALRYDMYLFIGTTFTTEYAIAGINHSGNNTNWFRNSGNGFTNSTYDGVWCFVETDASGTDDYMMMTAPVADNAALWTPTILARNNATPFIGIFKSPPFSSGGIGGGSPANTSDSTTKSWADVEISQVNNIITLKINNTVILQTANTTAFKSGNIMLGYDDAYDSIGNSLGVIYDNVRVVDLSIQILPPYVQFAGPNIEIFFKAGDGDLISSFTLQQATAVGGPYNDVASTITSLGGGNFKAVTAAGLNPEYFYRVRRN